jgi:hypothetical protein
MTTDRGLSQLCGRLTYGVALDLLFGFYQGEIGVRIGPGVTRRRLFHPDCWCASDTHYSRFKILAATAEVSEEFVSLSFRSTLVSTRPWEPG